MQQSFWTSCRFHAGGAVLLSYPYPLNRTTIFDEGIHIRYFPGGRFALPWHQIELVQRTANGVRLQLGERSPVRLGTPRHQALIRAIVSVCPPDKYDPTVVETSWLKV